MGEYGFITADGVYHITVYATDEEGRFKILLMKNIKIGLPGEQNIAGLQSPRIQPTQRPAVAPPTSQRASKALSPVLTRACSGCAIPKIDNSSAQKAIPNSEPIQPNFGRAKSKVVGEKVMSKEKLPVDSQKPMNSFPTRSQPEDVKKLKIIQQKGDFPRAPTNQRQQPLSQSLGTRDLDRKPSSGKRAGKGNSLLGPDFHDSTNTPLPQPKISQAQLENHSISDTGSGVGVKGQVSKAKQQNSTSAKTSINRNRGIGPGDAESLMRTMLGLLYRFNYTVGYHGHHEKGFVEGSKVGEFYMIGRDGIRHSVEYKANEFGYQPHIFAQTETSANVPNVKSEKDAGLKGYEFKWFH